MVEFYRATKEVPMVEINLMTRTSVCAAPLGMSF